MDTPHYDVSGTVSHVSVVNDGKNADVEVVTSDDEMEELRLRRFAFSQLLKFTDLRKGDLTNDENEVLPDAGSKVAGEIAEQDLVLKTATENDQVVGVVSPMYVSLPSEEISNLVRETITSMGISDFEHQVEREGAVTEQIFRFADETTEVEVGDTIDGGLFVRNSVFGASSLRINRYYTILACENGMVSRRSRSSFRQVHMGDASDLREGVVEEIEAQVEHIWEDTDLIDTVATIEFPIADQIDFLDVLADNGRVTKEAAGVVGYKIIDSADLEHADFETDHFDFPEQIDNGQEWNTGTETVWGLINGFTGYAEHSEMSSQSALQDVQRTYNKLLEVEDEQDVFAIAE